MRGRSGHPMAMAIINYSPAEKGAKT